MKFPEEIRVEDIPIRVFVDAEMKREVLEAEMISRNTRRKMKIAGGDVKVTSPLGHNRVMHREEVRDNYRYTNGNVINISSWLPKSKYVVFRETSTYYKAMRVPKGMAVQIGDSLITHNMYEDGTYIIFEVDSEGRMVKQSLSVISSEVFKRMFIILPNKTISKHSGKVRTVRTRIRDKIDEFEGIGEIEQDTDVEHTRSRVNEYREEVSNEKRFKALAKYVSYSGSIVGFLLADTFKGDREIHVSKPTIVRMCSNKLVSNISLAVKENGKHYLRGNGIKISELMSIPVNDITLE